MPTFHYAGQLRSGQAISGTVEADHTDAAMTDLRAAGIQVASLSPAAAMLPARPLSRDDLMYFNQQLAALAETGVALDQGLRILARDLRRGRLRKAVEDIAADLESGTPIDEAVRRRASLFPPLYGEILKSGVENNRLGTTLCNLSTHLSVMQESRRLFWESATYPIIIVAIGFVVLTLFMLYVVPQQAELVLGFMGLEYWDPPSGFGFSDDGFQEYDIPAATRWLFTAARYWPTCAMAIGGAVAGVLVLLHSLKLFPFGRRLREVLFSCLPGFYGVFKASLLARFSQAAALGASSGHDLPHVLRLAAGATGHRGLIGEADRLGSAIEAGTPLDVAPRTALIPAIFSYAAQVAGRRGQLAAALAEMARMYDAIARHRMIMLRAILTPILIIITALLLGFGIAAAFYPLTSIIKSLTAM